MQTVKSWKIGSKSRAAQGGSIVEQLEGRTLLSSVVVNTTADSTDAKGSSTVSLRDAVAIANAATSATTISFSPTIFATAKTITMTNHASLEFTNKIHATTVTGPAALLTVDGQQAAASFNNFLVDAGVTVSISNILSYRGAFTSSGILTLNNVTTSNDVFGNGEGGGVYNNGGTLTVSNSTFTGCKISSGNGAGVWNVGGSATLTNVTVTQNSVGGLGAGIYNTGKITVTNCTITGNTASNNGGGIYNTGTLKISNSIIAGNSSGTGPDVYGMITSSGHNLIGKTDGSTGWISADLTGTVAKPLNALLGGLANNGGPTQTLLPLAGSPAIDKGSNSLIPSGVTTDQRGLARIFNGTVDIGAVEFQPVIVFTAPANQTASQGTSKSVILGSFTALDATSPYKDTITWGDGSASTTLSLTAAGTIPATAHMFAKTGTITVTEVITDSKSNKSNTVTFTETVTAALGTISGVVFDDTNANGKQDKGEVGLGLFTVYLDLNNDAKLDTGDKSMTTDIHGNFSFTGLAAGTYYLRIVPDSIDTTTTPMLIKVVLTAGEISTGQLFGED